VTYKAADFIYIIYYEIRLPDNKMGYNVNNTVSAAMSILSTFQLTSSFTQPNCRQNWSAKP